MPRDPLGAPNVNISSLSRDIFGVSRSPGLIIDSSRGGISMASRPSASSGSMMVRSARWVGFSLWRYHRTTSAGVLLLISASLLRSWWKMGCHASKDGSSWLNRILSSVCVCSLVIVLVARFIFVAASSTTKSCSAPSRLTSSNTSPLPLPRSPVMTTHWPVRLFSITSRTLPSSGARNSFTRASYAFFPDLASGAGSGPIGSKLRCGLSKPFRCLILCSSNGIRVILCL